MLAAGRHEDHVLISACTAALLNPKMEALLWTRLCGQFMRA